MGLGAAPNGTFNYLFPQLQNNAANLLPTSPITRRQLIELGRTMQEPATEQDNPAGDAAIPAIYTYLGQFVDHDLTAGSGGPLVPQDLVGQENLQPLALQDIPILVNGRKPGFDLDSVYAKPAERAQKSDATIKSPTGPKMRIGRTSDASQGNPDAVPFARPAGKSDLHDLPRKPLNKAAPDIDREALIGDARNDENTIISQTHVAFLLAHNRLIDQGKTFATAKKTLTQHYQFIVIHDFLKRVADPTIVDTILTGGNKLFNPDPTRRPIPLEFAVAAYRFGHSMVRGAYNFNLNFNTSGAPGTVPATLQLLFAFTALSGDLPNLGNPAADFPTLPDNWIIEWERFDEARPGFNKARKIDTRLVEPLFTLPDVTGNPIAGDAGRLAVRNLLRGYLMRLPTGQAAVRALNSTLGAGSSIPTLTPSQLESGATTAEKQALSAGGFLARTPLWYYILAEACVLGNGERLGPLGSHIVAEVIIGLIRLSPSSILPPRRKTPWKPTLPSASPGIFSLFDLLAFAGVLNRP
jgi:hypothetical protein